MKRKLKNLYNRKVEENQNGIIKLWETNKIFWMMTNQFFVSSRG